MYLSVYGKGLKRETENFINKNLSHDDIPEM
jgi:hypothetical protein